MGLTGARLLAVMNPRLTAVTATISAAFANAMAD
jgi:hypothetical protein